MRWRNIWSERWTAGTTVKMENQHQPTWRSSAFLSLSSLLNVALHPQGLGKEEEGREEGGPKGWIQSPVAPNFSVQKGRVLAGTGSSPAPPYGPAGPRPKSQHLIYLKNPAPPVFLSFISPLPTPFSQLPLAHFTPFSRFRIRGIYAYEHPFGKTGPARSMHVSMTVSCVGDVIITWTAPLTDHVLVWSDRWLLDPRSCAEVSRHKSFRSPLSTF